MATITFNCPQCDCICAFKDVYAGRRAKCLRCNQLFIIPHTDKEHVKKIKLPKEYDEPLPGFYEAVFKKSWPAIFNKKSFTTLIFILIVITFKFFVAHLNFAVHFSCQSGGTIFIPLPFGTIFSCLAWGAIFWCYAEIIMATAYDNETLPAITFGGGFGYIMTVLGSLISFFAALLVVFVPAIIFKFVFSYIGITSKWALVPFIILGLFLFPMAVLLVSMSRDICTLFRPSHFIIPIKKTFPHYLFLVSLFSITWFLWYITKDYGRIRNFDDSIIILNLFAALFIQILAVFSMRATGLFYRHFNCYFRY